MFLKELEYLYHKIPDYKITPFLSIKHPTYEEIVEYGEEKYVNQLYRLCTGADDYKSELWGMAFNWYEMDDIAMFYLICIQPGDNLSLIFSSDIHDYKLYENKENGRIILYNPILETELTSKHIKLIKQHLNSMIGNMYKIHKEYPDNDKIKKHLIEVERKEKEISKRKDEYHCSIKDVIMSVLYNNFYEDNDETIKNTMNYKPYDEIITIPSVYGFKLGELDIIKRISENIYEDLQNILNK